ncbi:ABC transporter ATP-binding protein/permease [Paenibacillus sp. ACRRX]|uniref:ABC transporter ATP-binding protein n=1 Tax=Paenibacillus sp. ACRRX TaxID=2918206 RepID=UPI001EF6B72C|nr:ABC transporter ATP-binding protein [Paenibacillus sp. ACRRX]MCG7406150.1 ABC transporter ATP-binding protein/permease [Paenibacillus sp. ACRRX]
MRATRQLPTKIKEQVKTTILYYAWTDLSLDNHFCEQWLTVTADEVTIWSASAALANQIQLADIINARTVEAIGGGSFIVDQHSGSQVLLRYSAGLAAMFGYAAKLIMAVVQDDVLPEASENDSPHVCSVCSATWSSGARSCPACRDHRRVLSRMLGYAKTYKKQMTVAASLLVVTTLIELIPPYITKIMVDDVLQPMNLGGALLWLVIALASTELVLALGQIVRGFIGVRIGAKLMGEIRTDIYNALMGMSLAFFDRRQTSQFIGRVNNDSEAMRQFLTDGLMWVGGNALKLIAIILVMLTLDWKLTLLAVLPVPLIILFSVRIWPKVRRMWYRQWRSIFRLNGQVGDSLSGIRVVKAFGQEQAEKERYAAANRDAVVQNVKVDGLWSAVFPIFAWLAGSGVLLTWYFGGDAVLRNQMTLGVLMAFIAYLGMFLGPLQWFSQAVNWTNQALSAADRVFEIMDTPVEVADTAHALALHQVRGEVRFEQVSYGYEANRTALKEIDLTVKAGEMIGLVGHSGAGKSTFIHLLCRFYDPGSGRILLDGTDLRHIRQEDLRRHIGIVLQETFLFDGTIAENIAYSKPDASPMDIIRAASIANAHDFIVRLSHGYDTRVGERGHRLSGGEKQRVAIARAIIHNPRILILDEATASVDTNTERQIQEAISQLIKGRTTFAIAHRLSTLKDADRLVVLDQGRIAEIGTHEELMSIGGKYFSLVEAQQELSSARGRLV